MTKIKTKAAEIRQKIKDGRIYNQPVDLIDSDSTLVAAYWLGFSEARPELFPKIKPQLDSGSLTERIDALDATQARIKELQSELKNAAWLIEQLVNNRLHLSSAIEELENIKLRNLDIF